MDAVVVTYNSRSDLAAFLAAPHGKAAFTRVIVVDSASTDGSADLAARSRALLIRRPSNAGFGAGVNAGVKAVEGDVFAVLNPDIGFDTAIDLHRVLAHFSDPQVAIVAPALRLPDGRLQDSARAIPSPGALVARRLLRTQATRGAVTVDQVVDVPWAMAACWFVSRQWFDRLGGFDERYFLYFEDVDFCVRVGERGGIVRFDPGIVLLHRHGGASRSSPLGRANRHHVRSAIRFFASHPHHIVG